MLLSVFYTQLTETASFDKTPFFVILSAKKAFAAARQMPARRIPADRMGSDGSSGAAIVLDL